MSAPTPSPRSFQRPLLALVIVGGVAGGVAGARYMRDFARLSKNTSACRAKETGCSRCITSQATHAPLSVLHAGRAYAAARPHPSPSVPVTAPLMSNAWAARPQPPLVAPAAASPLKSTASGADLSAARYTKALSGSPDE